jgi:putative holliday junction resolvase
VDSTYPPPPRPSARLDTVPAPPYPRPVRVLAVDFGEKRVGLAVSDETGAVVVPVGAVLRRSDAQAASEVASAARERDVELLVVGLPIRSGGDESPFAQRARSFARKLAELSGLPVELHGEALTSVSAEGALRDAGFSRERRAAALDSEAAAELLRDFLFSRTGGGAR